MASHENAHAGHDDGKVHVHIAPTKFYVGILGALLFLTFITVYVSYFDFGSANTLIAVLVATVKASLVAAFFMHLRHDRVFNTISFVGAFVFLSLLIIFSYDDLGKRARVDPMQGGVIDGRTGQPAPGGKMWSPDLDKVEAHGPGHATPKDGKTAH